MSKYEIYFEKQYRNKKVREEVIVNGIDKTHSLRLFWKWVKKRYKKAFIKIISHHEKA